MALIHSICICQTMTIGQLDDVTCPRARAYVDEPWKSEQQYIVADVQRRVFLRWQRNAAGLWMKDSSLGGNKNFNEMVMNG